MFKLKYDVDPSSGKLPPAVTVKELKMLKAKAKQACTSKLKK